MPCHAWWRNFLGDRDIEVLVQDQWRAGDTLKASAELLRCLIAAVRVAVGWTATREAGGDGS